MSRRVRRGAKRRARHVLQRLGLAERASPPVRSSAPTVSAAAPVAAPVAQKVSPFAGDIDLAALPPRPALSPQDDTAGPPLTREQVQEVFDDMVRPALQADGGDIVLVKVEDNSVFVQLQGACTTCPSSTITMRMGIERLLRDEFPQFRELVELHDAMVG